MSFGRLRRDEQVFFLNTQKILGIQSIRGGYSNNRVPLLHLGMVGVSGLARGPQISQFVLSALSITSDPFIHFSGNSGFNGSIVRSVSSTGQNFSFTSGFLTNYSLRASVGRIPEYTADIAVFGNIGKFITSESAQFASNLNTIAASSFTTPNIQISGPNSLNLTLDEFNTNRVLSFDLNLSIPRTAVYALGSRNTIDVQRLVPMEITFKALIEGDNYSPRKMRDFPGTDVVQTIGVQVRENNSDVPINTYTFPNMKLENENYSSEVDGNVSINLEYKGYIV